MRLVDAAFDVRKHTDASPRHGYRLRLTAHFERLMLRVSQMTRRAAELFARAGLLLCAAAAAQKIVLVPIMTGGAGRCEGSADNGRSVNC